MPSLYRVLDLRSRGLLCGQILADLVADVIQVEAAPRPSDDPSGWKGHCQEPESPLECPILPSQSGSRVIPSRNVEAIPLPEIPRSYCRLVPRCALRSDALAPRGTRREIRTRSPRWVDGRAAPARVPRHQSERKSSYALRSSICSSTAPTGARTRRSRAPYTSRTWRAESSWMRATAVQRRSLRRRVLPRTLPPAWHRLHARRKEQERSLRGAAADRQQRAVRASGPSEARRTDRGAGAPDLSKWTRLHRPRAWWARRPRQRGGGCALPPAPQTPATSAVLDLPCGRPASSAPRSRAFRLP